MIAMAHIETLPRIEPVVSRLSDLLARIFHWPEFSPLEDAEERADLWGMIERNPDAFTSNSSIQDLMSLYPRH
jgi:hypothetical protein